MQAEVVEHEMLTPQVFSRQVLPIERVFLRSPAANISLVARVNGFIAEDLFQAALAKVQQAHPLLGVRVHLNDDQEAVFTSDEVPPFPVKICPRTSEDQWFQEILEQHHLPFNVERGPLVRFILLRSPTISEIIIFCQHMICDGMSLAFLMKDILLHLGDPSRRPDPPVEAPLLVPDNFPVNISRSLLARLFMRKINNSWKKHKVIFDYEDFRAIHRAYWNNYTYGVLPIEMTAAETADFAARCRQNQVTVTSALCAAFLAARQEVLGDEDSKPTVYVPVDLRSRLKTSVSESLGLYASGVKFKFRYDPKRSHWDNTRALSKQLGKEVKGDKVFQNIVNMDLMVPTLWDAQSFSFLGKVVSSKSDRYPKLSGFSNDEKNPAVKLNKGIRNKAPELSVTNLGRLDFPLTYGPFELDTFYFVPSTGPFLEIVLGVVTAGRKLTITVNYIEENITKATAKAIKERATKYLHSSH